MTCCVRTHESLYKQSPYLYNVYQTNTAILSSRIITSYFSIYFSDFFMYKVLSISTICPVLLLHRILFFPLYSPIHSLTHPPTHPLTLSFTHSLTHPTHPSHSLTHPPAHSQERVVGLHVLSPNAGEITQGYGLAMKLGATKADFDSTIGIHPTCSENFTTLTITKNSGVDSKTTGC